MDLNNIIKTTQEVVPIIYAYTTPEIPKHNGWTKIGETMRSANKRIEEQTLTADVDYKLEWKMNAVYEASNEVFRDYDFHAYLVKNGIERKNKKNHNGKLVDLEWFKILPNDAKLKLIDFRSNRGIVDNAKAMPYTLRDEQMEAVDITKNYFESHDDRNVEFLWNAKPRFGKTLTTYDLCKKLDMKNILIVTNRPSIANSWYSDYEKFLSPESGYYFISDSDSLKGKKCVISRDQFIKSKVYEKEGYNGAIHFVSLQDLKGSVYFGGQYDKLDYIYKGGKGKSKGLTFDLLVIDEAHEGVDTYKTDNAFNNIDRKWTLHLSGTPFKALANNKFERDAIYNWTYADEQYLKNNWNDEDRSNPYKCLPKLNLLTYKMSDIVFDKASKGADFNNDGDNEAYAFDLNEFFMTNDKGSFVHDSDIDVFLDALTSQKKFPFSKDYRDELKHTLWILNRVSSAKALYSKLKKHDVFKEYEIVLAAGDGKINDENNTDDAIDTAQKKSYDRVIEAIKKYDKTITISVGQLTTGITIPEWTAVMMLSNMKSPALYMQAAFRAQNPCDFKEDGKIYRKENAYVFDFDPARTLDIYEQFSNGLYSDTASGKGNSDTRKNHIRELINFFPVYGEDDQGEMIELDAEKVMSIPRSIHAKEVVRRGFMCNFLFQNISGIFSAPSVVSSIITKLEPVDENILINRNTKKELSIDENGNVNIPEKTVIGKANEVFGNKIYRSIEKELQSAVQKAQNKMSANKIDDEMEKLKEIFYQELTDVLIDEAKNNYGKEMSKSIQNEVTAAIDRMADKEIEQHISEFKNNLNILELNRTKEIEKAKSEGRSGDIKRINDKFKKEQESNQKLLQTNLYNAINEIIKNAGTCIVGSIEKDKKVKAKKDIEDQVRDHLRGFSRTIPSFLMAYGDENTNLKNFDKIIPKKVFLEVTGISIEEFKFLRDGGTYKDKEDNNKVKQFDGKLFDEVVFNDSIKEFLKKKEELSNYFDEESTEDIFDYIPPQKTNQIFTPRNVVVKMVDYLEQENLHCFDDPNATFIDLYMKSGLYITEIVKRLYRSKGMKKHFPNEKDRLKNIFKKQVYGLAPTEIIYKIATNFIFGFDKNESIKVSKDHFKMLDSLPYAKNEERKTLEEKLDEIFK